MADKLRFGIIGTGVIAPFHARSIRALPNDAELVGFAGIEEPKASNMAREFGVKLWKDYREMLSSGEIDVVNICTPSGMHGDMAIDAAKAGVHVIAEKPMDITLPKADAMIQACRKAGVKLTVISQRRYDAGMQQMKKITAEGRLGKLIVGDAYVKWYRSQAYYDSGDWRGTWALDGGGALMNQSVHYVDQLQWIMGPVETIFARTGTLSHTIEVEDVASAVLTFKNGAIGVIQGTTSAFPGFCERIEVHGTKGSMIVSGGRITSLHIEGEEAPKLEEKSGASASADPAALAIEGHRAQVDEMIKAIREDRDPFMSGEEARKPLEIILGIYKSAKTGEIVRLPLK